MIHPHVPITYPSSTPMTMMMMIINHYKPSLSLSMINNSSDDDDEPCGLHDFLIHRFRNGYGPRLSRDRGATQRVRRLQELQGRRPRRGPRCHGAQTSETRRNDPAGGGPQQVIVIEMSQMLSGCRCYRWSNYRWG